MTINLQISDSVYKALIAGNNRIQGSIGLVSPTEGNFNEHHRTISRPGTRYIKLPHGRASVGDKVKLTLSIALDEEGIIPGEAILEESRQASDFVDNTIDSAFRFE